MENIINLVGGSFILIATSIVFAIILLDEKKFKITLDKIIVMIIGILFYCLVVETIDGTIKSLILGVLYIVIYRYMFKTTYSESLFLAFMHIILIIIPDTLYLLFLINIMKIEPEICYTQYAGTILSTIIVNALFIILVYIFRKWLKKLVKIKLKNDKVILIYTVLTLSCVLIIFYTSFEHITVDSNLLLSALIMLVFVIILYSLMKQKIENNSIVEKYDKLLEFIKKYERAIEEQKALRHESKNQLITIKSKIVNEVQDKKIIEYVDSILKDYTSYDEDKYGKFQYLPANGLKGLFYYKAMEAEEKGIKLSINVAEKVEKSILNELSTEEFKQLGRLIGVYFDNAIEASHISEEKKLGIEIYMHKEDAIIVITNTYTGVIDTESVGKVRYSTKGKNRGYGLMLVSKILSSYKRFEAERQVTDKIYVQKLTIKKEI